MQRNQAGQVVTAKLISRSDGTAITTGTVTVSVLGAGGTLATGTGTVEHEGAGTWSYFPSQSETNFAQVTFAFRHDDAISVDVAFNDLVRATAGQVVTANLVNRTDGTDVVSGTVTVNVLGDGGTQAAGTGTITHEGAGTWSYVPTAAETDYPQITFSFAHADAIGVDVQVSTTTDSEAAASAPDLAEAAADPASITIDGVTVVNRSIDDQIKAARYLAQQTAATHPTFGMFIRRVNPGSAVRE